MDKPGDMGPAYVHKRTDGARGYRGSGEGVTKEASFVYEGEPEVAAHMDSL